MTATTITPELLDQLLGIGGADGKHGLLEYNDHAPLLHPNLIGAAA